MTTTTPLRPADPHDRLLLERVHPPGWTNPRPRDRYHLVVLGGGTGGLVSAAIAAGLGARVALVERGLLGGDCLNVGCVPSKSLIRSAAGWSACVADPDGAGAEEAFQGALDRLRRVRSEIAAHDSAERFTGLGVDVFLGQGVFTGPDRIEVGGATLRFRRAILATGTRPVVPEIDGLAEAQPLTNESVFSLERRPETLLVLGGGSIGCELAQAFARFGTRVVLVETTPRLLPRDDGEAAAVLRAALERDGIRVLTDTRAVRFSGRPGHVTTTLSGPTGEEALEVEQVLVAAGRAANLDGLGLEDADIETVGGRALRLDERLRTSNPRVYAVGDVAGRHAFTHAADAHARLAVQNALFFRRLSVDDLVVPWCTYTTPEVAQVGLRSEEADAGSVDTLTIPMREVDRGRVDGEEDGFFRVHLEGGTDRILGATMVSSRAGDIITLITQAMRGGLGLDHLGDTIFPYPTQAEAVRKAADARRRTRLTPRVRRGFDLFFRAVR